MKKLSAILLLTIGLFNLGGYRLLTAYWETSNAEQLLARIDKAAYSEEDLISVKTPLNLPYYASSKDFERVDGDITIEGVSYKYVKRRIYNDTLELLCIKDAAGTNLKKAKTDFFTLSNDLASHSNKKTSNVLKAVCFEYCQSPQLYDWTSCAPDNPDYCIDQYPLPFSQYLCDIDKPPCPSAV